MRRTFKDNCKSATQVKMLKNVDNSRYIRNLVMNKMMMIQRYDDGTTDMKELINIIMKPLVTMLLPMARLPPYAQYDPEK